MKLYRLLILVVLLSAGCGEDAPRLSELSEDAVIVAFGDSLTRGTGAGNGESYPDVLARLSGRKIVNEGIPGEQTPAGLARLERVLDTHQPALLLLCHGGNDMLRKKSLATAQANIETMIAQARERGIEVVLLGVPEPGIFLSTADFYHDIAERTGVPLIADTIADVLGEAELKSDPVHPNALGYARIAENVHAALIDYGAL